MTDEKRVMSDSEMRRLREDAESDENEEFGSETVLALLDRVAAAEAEVDVVQSALDEAEQWASESDRISARWRGRAEKAEAEVKRLQRIIDGYDRTPAEQRAADAEAETAALRATVERVREALSYNPVCDVHPDDDVITCGWKRAVADVQGALDGDS